MSRDPNEVDKPFENRTILIVDDLQDNIDVVARRLRSRGANVLEANDGYEALELLTVSPVDVILLDVMMPGISGLDVVKRIRTKRSAAALPIIMVSARSDQEIMVQCLEAGANDYVQKPVDFALVSARVTAQLAIRETYRAALNARSREIRNVETIRAELNEAKTEIERLRATG